MDEAICLVPVLPPAARNAMILRSRNIKAKTVSCHPELRIFLRIRGVFKRDPSLHGESGKQNGSRGSACVSYREFLNIMITVLTYRIKYDIVKSQSQRSPDAMIARQRSVFRFRIRHYRQRRSQGVYVLNDGRRNAGYGIHIIRCWKIFVCQFVHVQLQVYLL